MAEATFRPTDRHARAKWRLGPGNTASSRGKMCGMLYDIVIQPWRYPGWVRGAAVSP